jgi:ankyrin repeat protein
VPCLPLFAEEFVHGQLIRAAKNGHVDQMHRLVRRGADVNCSNERGQTPLIRAAERGRTEAVVQLLKLRADIGFADRHDSTALHYAAFNGHQPTLVVLLSKSAHLINAPNKFGYTPLHYAAADGHAPIISALVSRGADVNHVDNMQLTALHRAAAGGHVSAINELVRFGASVHGVPPVKVARGQPSVVRQNSVRSVACLDLLVAPVQEAPAAPCEDSTEAGVKSAEATSAAVTTDSTQESDRYREHMLYTPLHEASWCNQLGSVKALISLGAAVLAKDKWGKTPLGKRQCSLSGFSLSLSLSLSLALSLSKRQPSLSSVEA